MKKIIFAAIMSVLLLAGCFGFLKKEEAQKPAAQEVQRQETAQTPAATSPAQKTSGPLPSFQDGENYLQALAKRDAALCKKIVNSKLKEKCETKVSAK